MRVRVPLGRPLFVLALLYAGGLVVAPPAARALVISELYYNAVPGDEALEFVELTNESAGPVDLSGYAFVEGIRFTFPDGLVLASEEILVLCADVDAVRARYRILNAVGNYEGRLDAGGERLTLVNHVGVEAASVRFRDRGKWPVVPDGTGYTLVLESIRRDPREPESWTHSPRLGGSPGERNFPPIAEIFDETVLVDAGEEWRFAKGTEAFSTSPVAWIEPAFDDSSWLAGASGFGYGDDDDATLLDDMRGLYTTVAVRKRFPLTAEILGERDRVILGVVYDDGFCAYVNGVEIARINCPEEAVWDATATASAEAGDEAVFRVPQDLLVVGDNVVAIVGFNRNAGNLDFSLRPRLLHRRFPAPTAEPLHVSFNELLRAENPGAGWIELHNLSPQDGDLSGLRLTDDPDRAAPYVFPPDTQIPANGYLVVQADSAGLDLTVDAVRLFLVTAERLVVTAASFDRGRVDGLKVGTYSEARFPETPSTDGRRKAWLTATPTPGETNVVPQVTDVVLNEIFYHPPLERDGEFLELYHRGTEPRDLGGFRFTKGVDYTFDEGVVLMPGEYLVVAQDPDLLRGRYGLSEVLGPYAGTLADGGENVRLVDRFGNLVDEVRYYDGGDWPLWPDGRGASLELLDPLADNDFAAAWESSDETDKTEWEEHRFSVSDYTRTTESELNVLFVEKGICRLDEIFLVGTAGDNLIPNPGFESEEEGTAPWRIQGTHGRSRRITTDSYSGTACLELVATGKGDTLCNRMETDTLVPMESGAYEISLWARWQRGSNLLVVHGEFSPGEWSGGRDMNLSGNPLARSLRLSVPFDLGTPGEENSVRARLRRGPQERLGPVIAGVLHEPPIPDTVQPVTMRARVAASAGVARVEAVFRVDAPDTEFSRTELFDDGRHDDAFADDGVYGGELPAVSSEGAQVVFFIEATDSGGATGRYPASAPERPLMYTVRRPLDIGVQIVLDRAASAELNTRPLHSNDLVHSAVVLAEDEVYYNTGMRYRGSPWGRSGQGFRLRSPAEKLFPDRQRGINLKQHDLRDGAANFLLGRAGTPEQPVLTSHYGYVNAMLNRQRVGTQTGLFHPVDRAAVERWYGPEAAEDGIVLKATGRFRFTDTCSRPDPFWDDASLDHKFENAENYRFYYFQSLNQTRDNWVPWMDLTRVMDARSTPDDAEFDRQIDQHLDVESFFRVIGPRVLMNDTDGLFLGNGHNGYAFWDPRDERWELIPQDMGVGWREQRSSLFSFVDPHAQRLVQRPEPRRIYLRFLYEYLNGYWNPARAAPFVEALPQAAREGNSILPFIETSARRFSGLLEPFTTTALRVLSNDGADFAVQSASVVLEGEAPVQITELLLKRGDGEPEAASVHWTTATRWQVELAVTEGPNRLEFLGVERLGDVVAGAAITIMRAADGVFVRGDVDGDARITLRDPLALLSRLFRGERPEVSGCLDAADADDNGRLEVTDAIVLLEFLFRRGPAPADPFPKAGVDESEDELSCLRASL